MGLRADMTGWPYGGFRYEREIHYRWNFQWKFQRSDAIPYIAFQPDVISPEDLWLESTNQYPLVNEHKLWKITMSNG